LALWLLLMALAIWLAAANWQDLAHTAGHSGLLGANLLLMSLIYPLVKLLHELGHGYATRHWGGEVREVGLLVLLFVPVPYVDASQSTAFASKWQRAGVASAGIVVELTLAALALIFWLNAEPGLAREGAFNIMLIGSVSTLLFNGNPLLRFDGYFILSDLIEIPNLGVQANRYFWYLVQRYLLKIRNLANPQRDLRERMWLVGYAVLSFVYRTQIVLAISIYIAGRFATIGLLLAIFALFSAIALPLFKGGWFLANSPLLANLRQRAVLVSMGGGSCLMFLFFVLPMPYVTLADGVFWPDPRSLLRTKAEGFIEEILVTPGTNVVAGQPIVRLADPSLSPRLEVAKSDVRQLELETSAVRMSDIMQAKILDQQLIYARKRLADLQETADELTVTSPFAGQVYLPGNSDDLIGHLLRKGQVLGYVWPVAAPVLRVAVHQAEAELVRTRSVHVSFVLKRDNRRSFAGTITAWVPDSTLDLPSKALSTEAGGEIVPDPAERSGLKALESLYLFEVTPDAPVDHPMIGERALVRFDHGAEPVGWRILRGLQQIFLRRFGV
jgi:putative peptide zinc metalloprotease protein